MKEWRDFWLRCPPLCVNRALLCPPQMESRIKFTAFKLSNWRISNFLRGKDILQWIESVIPSGIYAFILEVLERSVFTILYSSQIHGTYSLSFIVFHGFLWGRGWPCFIFFQARLPFSLLTTIKDFSLPKANAVEGCSERVCYYNALHYRVDFAQLTYLRVRYYVTIKSLNGI